MNKTRFYFNISIVFSCYLYLAWFRKDLGDYNQSDGGPIEGPKAKQSSINEFSLEHVNSISNENLNDEKPLNLDFSILRYPGVYEIFDIEQKKSYFGETSKFGERLATTLRPFRKRYSS